MKKLLRSLLLLGAFTTVINLYAQDVNVLLKEADNLEIKLKEPEALDKYKEVLVLEPNNIKALVKATELSCSIGGRLKDKNDKKLQYETALAFAKRAFAAAPNNADACYAMAVASGRMTDVETENKKIVAFVKDIKVYADKALAINGNHGKANYAAGKWHFEMVNLSGLKKAAVKVFYGGLPEASLDSAIVYMEKSRKYEPYFVINYLDLAKAYQQDNQPTLAIEVLQKMVRLPLRTADDAALKAEGQKMLDGLQ
jgi:tetratricopeptide (TPR) repeat protein